MQDKKKVIDKRWVLLFLCLVGFLEISEEVVDHEILVYDRVAYGIISHYFISDSITPIMKLITHLGGLFALSSIGVISLLLLKNKSLGICICSNLVLITGLNGLLKYIIQRERPTSFSLIYQSGYSFPSGHAMVGAAFYGFIIYLMSRYIKHKYIKWGSIIFLALLIALIGFSRIYLGVHYLSDVIAGFLISLSYLIAFTSITSHVVLKIKE